MGHAARPGADPAEAHGTELAADECLVQLQRTADWLRTLPLAKFDQHDGAITRGARSLIDMVHATVLELCGPQDTGAAVISADKPGPEDCPPAQSHPDVLATHALGDQLAVHRSDLQRCIDRGSVQRLQRIATEALALRT